MSQRWGLEDVYEPQPPAINCTLARNSRGASLNWNAENGGLLQDSILDNNESDTLQVAMRLL